MSDTDTPVARLAAALRPGVPDPGADLLDPDLIALAALHGVGPLLFARSGARALRDEAQALAMWDLRHRAVLRPLLAALHAQGLRAALMKGTALAYGLYDDPAQRPRGDSDLLVQGGDVPAVRAVLVSQGFRPFYAAPSDPGVGRTQEPWRLTLPDGTAHEIDLHWQVLNAPSLEDVLPVAEALAQARPLPRLSDKAQGLSRPDALLLAALHRAQHVLAPYFVAGVAQYGGDRLIWLVDIDLLARACDPEDWAALVARSTAGGVAPVVLGALCDAARLLGTPLPAAVLHQLAAAPEGRATRYLLRQGRVGRAVADLRARGPRRALGLALRRLFPPAEFMRMKYPGHGGGLAVLYLRRLLALLRRREA